jgi:predicted Kef-type K+ transport protein
MNKLESLMDLVKVNEMLGKKEEEKKKNNVWLWVLAIIGAVAAVAAIGVVVYRYLRPDYLEDFDDEFEDDLEDDFEDEDGVFEEE